MTETDRELLEFAAKAAGLDVFLSKNRAFLLRNSLNPSANRSWNPLEDDGDALRLAVRLDLFHRFNMDQPLATIYFDATDPDPYAATRRAIVRAAAEIGRNMK